MNRIISSVDRIQRATDAHVALVHHTGKDQTRGMRGHSSLHAALPVVVRVKKSIHARSFEIIKARDDTENIEFHFTLEQVALGIDEDDDRITSCVIAPVEGCNNSGSGKQPSLPEASRTALTTLATTVEKAGIPGGTIPGIIEGVEKVVTEKVWRAAAYDAGISKGHHRARQQAFRRARDKLLNEGFIGRTGEYFYVLPQPG